MWAVYLASITTSETYAAIGIHLGGRNESINLLWLPDAQIVDHGGISAAFALRAVDAAIVEESSWILPVDESHLSASFGWRLLGYDVADAWLSYSGLYGFTWQPGIAVHL